MRDVELATILVGGSATPWEAVGFAVDAAGMVPFGNGALEFTGEGAGLQGITVTGLGDDFDGDIEGISVLGRQSVPSIDHPNGAFELDHLVIMTDSLERTSARVTAVLGSELKRIRETDKVRQGFHRIGPGGCILEIVEQARVERVDLFGMVCNVADLAAVVGKYDSDVIGAAKDAVQPGRRIATFRSGAGLGVPTALMTPTS